MNYELHFKPKALKEWKKLNSSIKEQFSKKLKERLEHPKVSKDRLKGYENVYKIKLRNVGYRLAYEVKDEELIVLVLSVGKRENNSVYENLKARSK
jgi:mRNA interferase RelE/StbE